MNEFDPFGRVTGVPLAALSDMDREELDREERAKKILSIDHVADRLLDSADADAVYVGGALKAWLAKGGDLARDYLRVKSRRGSKLTPSALWAAEKARCAVHRDEDFEDGAG